MATAKNTRYVAAEQQEEYNETDSFAYPDGQGAAEGADAEPRCATCGELLAWHEQACAATPAPVADEVAPVIVAPAPGLAFAYELGHLVLPAPAAPARAVVWRGQLKERHPQTGLVHRVPVYRLDDGYWDCYREEELLAA